MPNYNTIRSLILCYLFFSFDAKSAEFADVSGPSAVVFGDSIASGAATHPALEFDGDVLWEILNGQKSVSPRKAPVTFLGEMELDAPSIVLPTSSEVMNHPLAASSEILMQTLGSVFLNTEEYSWGYQVARKHGVPGKKIFFASTNGARSGNFSSQVQRFLSLSGGKLPKLIFVMFTGNDLCSPYGDGVTSPELFHSNIEAAIKLLASGAPHSEGTRLVLAGMLPITQLYQSASILDKKVKAHGREVSCRDLRESSFARPEGTPAKYLIPAQFSQVFPPNPSLMCPNLFAPEKLMKDQISEVATTASLYRDQLESIASTYSGKTKGVSIEYIRELSKLTLDASDIAQDCFHLSAAGHSKIASKVIDIMH